jgi:two-component system sensor histidine kinase HydH
MFERVENVRLWRRLEVMQDIRVNDVDKRLSRFLSDLRKGHGSVYRLLFCTGRDGRVVAASDPAWIGRQRVPGRPWLHIPGAIPGGDIEVEAPTRDPDAVTLRAMVPDAFGKGTLGFLYVVLRWDEVSELLDEAVSNSARDALLLDSDGSVIAASRRVRERRGIGSLQLNSWYSADQGKGPEIRAGDVLGYASLLVGGAASRGYQHFPGFGWHLLMVVPTAVAFAPIWRLLWAMVALLLLTLLAAGWVSRARSRR